MRILACGLSFVLASSPLACMPADFRLNPTWGKPDPRFAI